MIARARSAAPAECCGLLLGRGDVIARALSTPNVADGADRFLIDPGAHIAARRSARQEGFEVLGFYHSHPRSQPLPSATDVEEASYPDHVHAIVGLAADRADVRLFRIWNEGFEEVPFEVVRA
jgi:proteasome lid subunit RPN8/RPN11